MGYTFARVGAAVGMKVEDYYVQKRRGWVRLHEKGGKVNELPCHHNLEQFLDEWLSASALSAEPAAPLFPTLRHGKLTGRDSLPQANVHMMIQRRAKDAGIETKISCHSFRATGITTYLQNGGKLEVVQRVLVQIALREQFEAKVFGIVTFVSRPSKCLAKQRRRTEFLSAPEPRRT